MRMLFSWAVFWVLIFCVFYRGQDNYKNPSCLQSNILQSVFLLDQVSWAGDGDSKSLLTKNLYMVDTKFSNEHELPTISK